MSESSDRLQKLRFKNHFMHNLQGPMMAARYFADLKCPATEEVRITN